MRFTKKKRHSDTKLKTEHPKNEHEKFQIYSFKVSNKNMDIYIDGK